MGKKIACKKTKHRNSTSSVKKMKDYKSKPPDSGSDRRNEQTNNDFTTVEPITELNESINTFKTHDGGPHEPVRESNESITSDSSATASDYSTTFDEDNAESLDTVESKRNDEPLTLVITKIRSSLLISLTESRRTSLIMITNTTRSSLLIFLTESGRTSILF